MRIYQSFDSSKSMLEKGSTFALLDQYETQVEERGGFLRRRPSRYSAFLTSLEKIGGDSPEYNQMVAKLPKSRKYRKARRRG